MFKKPAAAYEVVAHRVTWRPVDAVAVLLVAFLAPVFVTVTYVNARYNGEFPDQVSAVDLLALQPALWLSYLIGPWYVARRKGAGAKADYGLSLKASDVPVGLVAGVVTQLGLLRGLYWIIGQFVDGDRSAAARELAEPMSGLVDWTILTFAVVGMAPIVEEFFFRGLLMRSISTLVWRRACGGCFGPGVCCRPPATAAVPRPRRGRPDRRRHGDHDGPDRLIGDVSRGFNATGLVTLYLETH
ncbi:MAG: hypothetical protein R2706_09825 [Acidimicrobiales bacterium]